MSLIGALKAAKKTAPFYSAVDEALGNLKRPKGTGIEFLTEVLKQPGVKKAEIADRKLEQAFKDKGKMTKEEAQQVLADNPPPKLKEKVYDESTAIDEEEIREMVSQEMYGKPYDDIYKTSEMRRILDEVYKRMDENLGTTHGKWRTPNGENYREILLKLPSTRPDASDYTDPAKYDADLKAYTASGKKDYRTGHWKDDANVLAHMRVQDRVGSNGEKILHVEEIQSDWHQAGRVKGYGPKLEEQYRAYYTTPDGQQVDIGFGKTPEEVEQMTQAAGWNTMPVKIETEKTVRQIGEGVPDAPFKKNWHELAMKRLLNYAADNGYDSIAFTPGAEQAKRYSLSKQLNEVMFDPNTGHLSGRDHDGKLIVAQQNVTPENLPDYIGKEGAQKILETPVDETGVHALRGADLEVGGEGMKGFYDNMLPNYLNDFGKSYGAKVEMNSVPISTRDPKDRSWGGGQGDHPFMTSQDLNEPFDGMVELMRRNADTGEETLVGRMLRADSERRIAQELQKLDTVNQIKLHNFPITPEMRESIKQKGLPLYQQVGIPTAGAGAASQMLEPQEEPEYSKGGSIAKMAALAKMKKLKEEMAPRAEAVKSLIARDQNRYLADVAPNSLTNAEIQAEIKRMAARAKASGQQEGVLPRAERDANLGKFLKDAPVKERLFHATNNDFNDFRVGSYLTNDPDYAAQHGNRVMPVHMSAKNIKQILDEDFRLLADRPNSLKPYIDEGYDALGTDVGGSYIILDPRKVKSAIGNRGTYDINEPDITKAKGGTVRMTKNRDAMFMELSNKKLKRK